MLGPVISLSLSGELYTKLEYSNVKSYLPVNPVLSKTRGITFPIKGTASVKIFEKCCTKSAIENARKVERKLPFFTQSTLACTASSFGSTRCGGWGSRTYRRACQPP